MKRYVKTNTGIYELKSPNTEHQISFDHKTIEPAYMSVDYRWIAKKDIIADANTVEALYDGYYIDDLYTKVGFDYDGIFDEFDEFKDSFLCLLYEDKANIAGYAFIKTNRGFIFVAKMNDRGELNPIIQK